jgi:hypothetical protein
LDEEKDREKNASKIVKKLQDTPTPSSCKAAGMEVYWWGKKEEN